MAFPAGIANLRHESLHKGPVDAIILHPLEMQLHSRSIISAENTSRAAIGKFKRRRVGLRILSCVRPQVDLATAGREDAPVFVVMPMPAGAVPRGVEPTLVARHDETLISGIAAGLYHFLHGPIGIIEKLVHADAS